MKNILFIKGFSDLLVCFMYLSIDTLFLPKADKKMKSYFSFFFGLFAK